VIHTPNIIDNAAHMWRRLLGHSLCDVGAFSLAEVDELCEIAFTLQPTGARMYVSSMQEDGKNDDCLFYWLSMRNSPHFKDGSLVPHVAKSPAFASMMHGEITSIHLFGDPTLDAVYASLVQTSKAAFAMATARWLPNKQRFSRLGSDDLSVLDASTLQSCVGSQDLQLVAQLA